MLLGLAAMPGCAAQPGPDWGHVYHCTGTFHCLGRDWVIVPQDGCAEDEEDAVAQFEASLGYLKGAECEGTDSITSVCTGSSGICTLK